MKKGKILIAAPVHQLLIEGLKAKGYELLIQEDCTQLLGMQLIVDCVGLITSTRLLVNKELIDGAPMLRFVGRMGSGMEIIDVAYAQERGIDCFASAEGNCNAVAEHALGMLLALNKNILRSHIEIANGQWLREENRGSELEGKTIGIIGYGHTGRAFAKLLRGFDITILVYDKYKAVAPEAHIIVCQSLDEIYEQAEIVSFHVPFQQDTIHFLDENFVAKMKHPFVLLNTSRGAVVDCQKLPIWLREGKIKGIALDVWEEEPLTKMNVVYRQIINDLVRLPNVIFTPHVAGYSHESLYKMSQILLERITQ